MIDLDWSKVAVDGHIHAVAHLLSVLVILFFVVWYRPSSDRNVKLITRKLQTARESLSGSIEANKEK